MQATQPEANDHCLAAAAALPPMSPPWRPQAPIPPLALPLHTPTRCSAQGGWAGRVPRRSGMSSTIAAGPRGAHPPPLLPQTWPQRRVGGSAWCQRGGARERGGGGGGASPPTSGAPRASAAGAWADDVVPYASPPHPRVEAPPGHPPLLLLPGFGNCSADYLAPFGDEEMSVVAALKVCRHPAGGIGAKRRGRVGGGGG